MLYILIPTLLFCAFLQLTDNTNNKPHITMKKTLISIALLIVALSATAQEKTQQNAYKREGKTFVQTKAQKSSSDQTTAYTWKDSKGNEYPIVLHTYTKGEKKGRTTAYVIRTPAKTGKEYKYYLPDGEKIAAEILNESK